MAKAINKKVIYKKVKLVVEDYEANLAVQCIRIKGDFELSAGDEITVSGELKKNKGVLEFGTGCTYVRTDEDSPITGENAVANLKSLQDGEVYMGGICAVSGRVESIERVKSEAPQNVSFYIGSLTMFVAAVFYMLMADLSFNNTSDRLIVAVLLSFGSAILFFLSASFSEKPVIMYVLKGIGVALAIGFVVYIHWFSQCEYFLGVLDKLKKAGLSKVKELAMSHVTIIVTLVLGYISVVAQAVNTVLVAVLKED